MARMPLVAAAAVRGRRHLVDVWATAPSAGNWQEPLGQGPWSSLPPETKTGVLLGASLLVIVIVCCSVCLCRLFCRGDRDEEQDTSRFVPGPWSNNDDNVDGVSAPTPLPLQEQQPLPASGDDGRGPWSNNGEQGDRPLHQRRRRRRRQQQPSPAVAEVPGGDVELALGGLEFTQAGLELALANGLLLPPVAGVELAPNDGRGLWRNSGEEVERPPQRRRRRRRQQQPLPAVAEVPGVDVDLALSGLELTQTDEELALANGLQLAPAADMELAPVADVELAPAAEVEIAPAPEPAPTLKCTFSTADGWSEGTCAICLSELVDGEKVRVLTACMHCFHATCVETWLRPNGTCPLCRAPTMAVAPRGRWRRRTQT